MHICVYMHIYIYIHIRMHIWWLPEMQTMGGMLNAWNAAAKMFFPSLWPSADSTRTDLKRSVPTESSCQADGMDRPALLLCRRGCAGEYVCVDATFPPHERYR